jgi:hypothetical protein
MACITVLVAVFCLTFYTHYSRYPGWGNEFIGGVLLFWGILCTVLAAMNHIGMDKKG